MRVRRQDDAGLLVRRAVDEVAAVPGDALDPDAVGGAGPVLGTVHEARFGPVLVRRPDGLQDPAGRPVPRVEGVGRVVHAQVPAGGEVRYPGGRRHHRVQEPHGRAVGPIGVPAERGADPDPPALAGQLHRGRLPRPVPGRLRRLVVRAGHGVAVAVAHQVLDPLAEAVREGVPGQVRGGAEAALVLGRAEGDDLRHVDRAAAPVLGRVGGPELGPGLDPALDPHPAVLAGERPGTRTESGERVAAAAQRVLVRLLRRVHRVVGRPVLREHRAAPVAGARAGR